MLSRIAQSLCSRRPTGFNRPRKQRLNRRLSIHSAAQFERLEERRLLAVGVEAWQFGTADSDQADAIAVGNDGSIYVSHSRRTVPWESADFFVSKFNAFGTAEWTIPLGAGVPSHSLELLFPQRFGVLVDETTSDPALYVFANISSNATVMKFDLDSFDPNGQPALTWSQQFPNIGDGRRVITGFTIDSSGIYITGAVARHTGPEWSVAMRTDAFVNRLRADTGQVEWADEFGDPTISEGAIDGLLDPEFTSGRSITVADGHVYLAAATSGSIAGPDQSLPEEGQRFDAIVRKYDASTGNVIWTDQFGGKGGEGDRVLEIAAAPSGIYVLLSSPGLNLGAEGNWWELPFKTHLRKYELADTGGSFNHGWDLQIGDAMPQEVRAFAGLAVDDTRIYVAGNTSPSGPDPNVFASIYSTTGALLDHAEIGTTASDQAFGLAVANGIASLAGYTNGQFAGQTAAGGTDAFVAKLDFDSDGDFIMGSADTDPSLFTNDFSDVANDGTTTGTITSRGDQILTIADAPSPDGVLIFADPSGGLTPALISVDNAIYEVDAGDSLTITRGSVITHVLAGSVRATYLTDDGQVVATATLDAGADLTFEPETVTFVVHPTSQTATEISLLGADGQQATATLSAGSELTFNAESFSFTAPPTNAEPVSIVLANGDEVTVEPGQTVVPPTLVQIDIRPGDEPNTLNLASNGKIAVSILSSETFDARHVIASSVIFAGASMTHSALEDTNGDGRLDLVLHFRTQETNLRSLYEELLIADGIESSHQTASVSLTGSLDVDGVDELFAGSDEMDLFLAGRALRELLEELAAAGAI